ncbi:glycoside hydrolase family 3 protein [Mangrovimonas sp. ST2L15]|uniref:beta-glucosidase n=1 Tax=Mangrovimonas sp. ST2L15 TaxID=1645916 RepID=UPI0006B65245|nr:glycoside hydrolase family 3 protein [Mangrovimonas sp. ST2L15]
MKYKSLLNILSAIFVLGAISCKAQNVPQLGKNPISEVIKAMTNEEKAHMLLGSEMFGDSIHGEPRMKAPGSAGTTYTIPRLNIPALLLADGPAGVRIAPTRPNDSHTYYGTAFPVGTALASSWNTELVEHVGVAIGEEVRDYGIDVLLAPALNIHRNPLCGRNFEYYSEDPLVSGEIAAAYINGVQSNGVGTSVKHFVANNQETNRFSIDAQISERAMREIYLKGFEMAIKKAEPWTVMSSYNKVNGKYTSESHDILQDILRNEWGFKGFVMSDWFGGYESLETIGNGNSNVVAQMNAGNDVLMPGTQNQYNLLLEAINSGELSEEVVNRNIEAILKVVLQSPVFKNQKFSNTPDLKGHAKIARESAAESMVLLKNNDGILPFSTKSKSVALFGTTSYNFISGGTGSGDVNEAYTVSLLEGLNNSSVKTSNFIEEAYVGYVKEEAEKERKRREANGAIFTPPKRMVELDVPNNLIDQSAKQDAMAIITIGRNSGEFGDRDINEDFYLAQDEIKLIENVSKAFHEQNKKVVVILNIGGVIETFTWKDKVDAILLTWQLGQEGGNAVADVLLGKVNPSGKLPMTFPVDYNNHLSSVGWPGMPVSDPKEIDYSEDIYVGYRYFDTFNIEPSYEFGFGKSYTSFTLSDLYISDRIIQKEVKIKVKVTNNGSVSGKEVVQLYVSAPGISLKKPNMELKGFEKTKILKPGQSQILEFIITLDDLVSFDDNLNAWVAENGNYKVYLGNSSKNLILTETFDLKKETIVEEVHDLFKN